VAALRSGSEADIRRNRPDRLGFNSIGLSGVSVEVLDPVYQDFWNDF
jgi:hypothetical protein